MLLRGILLVHTMISLSALCHAAPHYYYYSRETYSQEPVTHNSMRNSSSCKMAEFMMDDSITEPLAGTFRHCQSRSGLEDRRYPVEQNGRSIEFVFVNANVFFAADFKPMIFEPEEASLSPTLPCSLTLLLFLFLFFLE
ncbi:hypothetical protein GCK32_003869 [Trichostrongylus colubriformis]|uniref:Uncharacterized protein n=1 Tax=Trichostrongylus colubriformis TaxID=6319 RepID=A0AAN8FZI9_TRICO